MTRLGASMPLTERYYFSKPYHSWHASAAAQDSHTPLRVARTDMTAEEIGRRIGAAWLAAPTELDFAALVLGLLEVPRAAARAP